jgi:hypothetical protein
MVEGYGKRNRQNASWRARCRDARGRRSRRYFFPHFGRRSWTVGCGTTDVVFETLTMPVGCGVTNHLALALPEADVRYVCVTTRRSSGTEAARLGCGCGGGAKRQLDGRRTKDGTVVPTNEQLMLAGPAE